MRRSPLAFCGYRSWRIILQRTTDNVAEYWGLAHGLRQENISGYSPLSVNRESALLLLHLRTLQPQRTTHLVRLFQEARAAAKDLDLSIWGHHYHTYNKMADRLALWTHDSVQVHASSDHSVVMEVTSLLDNDVNHWLEAFHI